MVHAFAEAIQDIRQKVVEKGWFGEVVTPQSVTHEREGFEGTVWDGKTSEGQKQTESPKIDQSAYSWDKLPNKIDTSKEYDHQLSK